MLKVKYPIEGSYDDLEGKVVLIHRNEHGIEKAYALVQELEEGMTEVTDEKELARIDEAIQERRDSMVVSRFQAKVALHDANLLDQVESYIAQTDNVRLKFAWQEASFKRNSALIAAVAGELGLSDDQVDDLFEYAANVTE